MPEPFAPFISASAASRKIFADGFCPTSTASAKCDRHGFVAMPPRAMREARITPPSSTCSPTAAEAELKGAKGYGMKDYKIELAKRTLVRALEDLAGGAA